MIDLDVLGLQAPQPVVAKRFYDAPGPPPVTVQRSGPDPGGYVVSEPGLKEGSKGILAGSYVKPAVHLVEDLGQPAFGISLGPFDRDPLLFTPVTGRFASATMMVQDPLARSRMGPRMGSPLTHVLQQLPLHLQQSKLRLWIC